MTKDQIKQAIADNDRDRRQSNGIFLRRENELKQQLASVAQTGEPSAELAPPVGRLAYVAAAAQTLTPADLDAIAERLRPVMAPPVEHAPPVELGSEQPAAGRLEYAALAEPFEDAEQLEPAEHADAPPAESEAEPEAEAEPAVGRLELAAAAEPEWKPVPLSDWEYRLAGGTVAEPEAEAEAEQPLEAAEAEPTEAEPVPAAELAAEPAPARVSKRQLRRWSAEARAAAAEAAPAPEELATAAEPEAEAEEPAEAAEAEPTEAEPAEAAESATGRLELAATSEADHLRALDIDGLNAPEQPAEAAEAEPSEAEPVPAAEPVLGRLELAAAAEQQLNTELTARAEALASSDSGKSTQGV